MKNCAWLLQKGILVVLCILLSCHIYLPISPCMIMGEEMAPQEAIDPQLQLQKQTPDATAPVKIVDKSSSKDKTSESAKNEEPVLRPSQLKTDDPVHTKTVSTESGSSTVSVEVNETDEAVNATVNAHKSSQSPPPAEADTSSSRTAEISLDKTGESTVADSLLVQSTNSKIPLPKLELSLKKDVSIKTVTIEASKSPVLNEFQTETDTLPTLENIQTAKGKLQDNPETEGSVGDTKTEDTSTLKTDNITVSNGTDDISEESIFLITPEGENINVISAEQGDLVQSTATDEKEAEISGSDSTSEEMPSYNEWAQKKRAEQEKKGGSTTTTVTVQDHKGRQKNYASADCGAKIIGTNAEAQGASAVLNAYHDEYMLNPCTAKIWLVIELCEPIQAHKIEIANFELFSSSPREFSVFSSDRYPNREWTNLGVFKANDDKTVQKFILEPQTFHKFVKIEMLSHYGSEHFCPLSLVRIYGISEIEVLDENEATESRQQDEDNILPEDEKEGTSAHPPNLFVTAKDVVFSIVKQATKALTRDKHSQDSTSNLTINGTETLDNSSLPTNGIQSKDPCVSLNRQFSLWVPHSSSVELNHLALEASILQKLYLQGDEEIHLTNVTIGEEDKITDSVMHSLSCDYYFLTRLLQHPNVVHILHQCTLTSSDSSRTRNLSLLENSGLCRYFKVILGDVRFSALYELYKIQNKHYIPVPKKEKKTKEVDNETQSVIVKETAQSEIASTKSSEASVSTPTVQKDDDVSSVTLVRTPIPMPSQPKETASRGSQITIQTTLISQSSESLQKEIQPTKTSKAEPDAEKNIAESQSSSQPASLQSDSLLPLSMEASQNSTQFMDSLLIETPNSSEIESSVSSPIIESVSISGDISQDSVESKLTSPTLTESIASSSNILSTAAGDKLLAEGSGDKSCADAILMSDSLIDEVGMTSSQPSTLSSETSSSAAGNAGSSKVSAPVGSQKESVFVRLSNRIKALELNMSLSGQYLEELSQRYRKQMDEMQRAFNKTIGTLNDTARKAYERDMKQQEMIGLLQSQITNLSQTVANLVAERDTLHLQVIERHLVLMMAEVVLMVGMFFLCLRRSLSQLVPLNSRSYSKTSAFSESILQKHPGDRKRRNSVVGTVGHASPTSKHERRPSEEALNISGTYADLMIVEPVIPIMVDPPIQKPPGESKRKRQRNKRGSRELYRSISNSILGNQLSQHKAENGTQRKHSNIRLNSAGLLFGFSTSEAIPEQCQETKPQVIKISNNCDEKKNASSSHLKQTIGMNGHIKNSSSLQRNSESVKTIPNGNACKPLNSVCTPETKKDVFILKRLFHKLYSSNG